jgi:hypothetical protein
MLIIVAINAKMGILHEIVIKTVASCLPCCIA